MSRDRELRNIDSRDIYGAGLGFNLAETISARKRPSTAGAQLREAPTLEAEGDETQCRGRPIMLETGTAINELSRKLMWPSLRFQKTSS